MNAKTAPDRRIVVFSMAASMALLSSPAAAADPVSGRWMTHDGSGVVRIAPCGAKVCGILERVLDPKAPAHDLNNPNAQLRSKPLAGTMVLHDFVRSGTGWKDGRAYDPTTGNSYRAELEVRKDGRLKVTGCIAFLCRSRLWTRKD